MHEFIPVFSTSFDLWIPKRPHQYSSNNHFKLNQRCAVFIITSKAYIIYFKLENSENHGWNRGPKGIFPLMRHLSLLSFTSFDSWANYIWCHIDWKKRSARVRKLPQKCISAWCLYIRETGARCHGMLSQNINVATNIHSGKCQLHNLNKKCILKTKMFFTNVRPVHIFIKAANCIFLLYCLHCILSFLVKARNGTIYR